MTNIAIIGEAWGVEEAKSCSPFVGPAGYCLTQMLAEAGIHRADCFLTNVFNFQPPGNKIDFVCGPKETGIPGYPQLLKGKEGYVQAKFLPELERLAEELVECDPNVVVLCGNTPFWALCGKTSISKFRGTTLLSSHTVSEFKVLPIYHPSFILRQWDQRPLTVIDLIKAKRESEHPEIRRPKREIWIEPEIEDIRRYIDEYIHPLRNTNHVLSVDIETAGTRITCIGMAPSSMHGIVIPFNDGRRPGGSYWPNEQAEIYVWRLIKDILRDRQIKKLFQNGLYDIAFLWRAYGVPVFGAEHDTMLLHHALLPESLKSLGFLGSIYTDEGAWKHMRERKTTIKRDD